MSRALESIDRAWKAVRSAIRASQMTEAVERTAVAHQHLSVKAGAEIYKDTGRIVALDDDDLLWGDEDEAVALTVDADTFVRVMGEAADRLESQARSWDRKADEFETLIGQQEDRNEKLREELDYLRETAQEGDRYLDIVPRDEAVIAHLQDLDEAFESLELGDDNTAELQEKESESRWQARRAQDEAAQKRRSAEKARATARAQHRLVAMREVESEARRTADAAVAKARKRVMAATVADNEDPLPKDRTAELLDRFADLVGAHQNLRNTP